MADSAAERHQELFAGLVIAVEVDLLRWKARLKRDVKLARGSDVQMQPLFLEDSAHGEGHECLACEADGGIGIACFKRGRERPAVVPDERFVHNVERRAKLRRQPHCVTSADLQMAGFIYSLSA